jgi:hypothetical protein
MEDLQAMLKHRYTAGIRLIRFVVAIATMLISAVVITPATPANAEPVTCQMGAYIVSLSRVDTAGGTFDADLWMWSLCPDEKIEPLKTMEFVNSVKVTSSLDTTLQRGDQWWSLRKITGTFRQDFDLSNYPFDRQRLTIDTEDAVLYARDLAFTADTADSKVDPGIKLKNWKIDSFSITAGEVTHPTAYGDPDLAGVDSTYPQLRLEIGLQRGVHVADFLKATFVVYIAALLALVSLMVFDGRVGLLGAATFTVVLSFVSLDRLLGPHDELYLLDKIHFAALAVIAVAGAWGVRSSRLVSLGADKARVHKLDARAAIVLLVIYILLNVILVASAIRGVR